MFVVANWADRSLLVAKCLAANTRKTYRIWKRTVGTVKKSAETKSLTWFSRNVRHVCEEGFRPRAMYLLTLERFPLVRSTPSVVRLRREEPWSRTRCICGNGGSRAGRLE